MCEILDRIEARGKALGEELGEARLLVRLVNRKTEAGMSLEDAVDTVGCTLDEYEDAVKTLASDGIVIA